MITAVLVLAILIAATVKGVRKFREAAIEADRLHYATQVHQP